MASGRKPGPIDGSDTAPRAGGLLALDVADLPGPAGYIRISDWYNAYSVGASQSRRSGSTAATTSAATAAKLDVNPNRAVQDAALERLASRSEDFTFSGRTLRFIRGEDWKAIAPSQRYQRISWVEGQNLIKVMMAASALAPAQKAALQNAAELLHDPRHGPIENGLALLRQLPVASSRESDTGAAITPSQLRKITQEVHWIEIRLVDESNNPVVGEPYVITTPDNTDVPGFTDGDGFARLDAIVAGQCKVCFPKLDRNAWSKTG